MGNKSQSSNPIELSWEVEGEKVKLKFVIIKIN